MKTRLTEMLHIEHPVMLAGMGGVAYSASRPRSPTPGLRLSRGLHDVERAPLARDRRHQRTHDQTLRG